jgi:predicted nucleic acid-binding protein
MNGVEVFFDTNVLVYHNTFLDEPKQAKAAELIYAAIRAGCGGISAQVMQECVSVLHRKFAVNLSAIDLYVNAVLRPLYRIDTTAELIESAIEIKRRFGFSLYDCLVIAAALACGAKTLYSEDLQHGQRIEHLTIVNPFI